MMKITSGLPVKTRVPLAVWSSAGLATVVSLILHSHQIVDAAPHQLASVAHLFAHASAF
jgi:hypothetical protein